MVKVIVSGHSRGLGAAIAENLLMRGVSVLGVARQKNVSLQAEYSQLLTQYEVDLADTTALLNWLKGSVLTDFIGGSDSVMLVNNAATVHPVGALEQLSVSAIANAVALNVSTPLILASAVAASQCHERRILHISSGAGRDPYAGWGVYCATKAALDHHARATALDNNQGLRISSIAPGVIDTDMQADLRAVVPDKFPLSAQFHAIHRNGQLSSPSACAARLVDFLMSPQFGNAPVTSLSE